MPTRRALPGRSPAQDADAPYDDEGRPSRSQRKRDAHELQDLAGDLATLPPQRLAALDMPPALREGLLELQRTRSHEGRRRQLHYVGKLVRTLVDDPQPLRDAVASARLPSARETLALHEVEAWRARLLSADHDAALTEWMRRFPDTELQPLRQAIRAAQATQVPDAAPGVAQRQQRAFRALFQILKAQLWPEVAPAAAVEAHDAELPDPFDPTEPVGYRPDPVR